jgi:hypothetical protein
MHCTLQCINHSISLLKRLITRRFFSVEKKTVMPMAGIALHNDATANTACVAHHILFSEIYIII